MRKILLSSILAVCFVLVHANNVLTILTVTDYIASGESQNLIKFENNLHNSYLITGDKDNYHNIYEQMRLFKIPGVSIVAIHDGKIVWIKSYGVKNSETKEILTPQTMFEVGSISKPFSALGTLQLATSGKIDLDKNINTYLKNWQIPANPYTVHNPVTARLIMTHLAGINVHGFPGLKQSVKPLPSIIDVLNGKKPFIVTESVNVVQRPGSSEMYSGGGYSILQLAMQDITHMDFATWMNNNVLKAFNMNQSTFEQPLPRQLQGMASSAHDKNGKVLIGNYHNYPEDAAAGLWSTSTDLAKALILLMNAYYGESQIPGINAKYTHELFIQQKSSQFGLGLKIDKKQHILSFGHNGGDDGFISNMIAYVNTNLLNSVHELKDGLVIMTNSDTGGSGILIDELNNSFTDIFKLDIGTTKHFKPITTPKNLSKYVTKFTFSSLSHDTCCKISLNNKNQLLLSFSIDEPDNTGRILYPVAKNEFVSEYGDKVMYSWVNGKLNLKMQYKDGLAVNVIIKQ